MNLRTFASSSMPWLRPAFAFAGMLALAGVSVSSGEVLELQPTDQGNVGFDGSHAPSETSYLTADNARGFFVFDLADLPPGARVMTAELSIFSWWVNDPPAMFEVRRFGGGAAILAAGDPGIPIFDALGSGPLSGSVVASASSSVVVVTFNGDAREALSAAAGGSVVFALNRTGGGSYAFSSVRGAHPSNRLLVRYTLPAPVTNAAENRRAAVREAARAKAYRHMQAQQATARRIAAQQRLAQHRRNQQR